MRPASFWPFSRTLHFVRSSSNSAPDFPWTGSLRPLDAPNAPFFNLVAEQSTNGADRTSKHFSLRFSSAKHRTRTETFSDGRIELHSCSFAENWHFSSFAIRPNECSDDRTASSFTANVYVLPISLLTFCSLSRLTVLRKQGSSTTWRFLLTNFPRYFSSHDQSFLADFSKHFLQIRFPKSHTFFARSPKVVAH